MSDLGEAEILKERITGKRFRFKPRRVKDDWLKECRQEDDWTV